MEILKEHEESLVWAICRAGILKNEEVNLLELAIVIENFVALGFKMPRPFLERTRNLLGKAIISKFSDV